jgi:uncharacterized protein (UPF0332 family)
MPGRRGVRSHLELAKGFLETAIIEENATEVQIRNALSRGYYALLHVCNALLLSKNVGASKFRTHEKLAYEIGRRVGEQARAELNSFYAIRRDADYTAGWVFGKEYAGSLDRFRLVQMRDLQRMREEFDAYLSLIGSDYDGN